MSIVSTVLQLCGAGNAGLYAGLIYTGVASSTIDTGV